MKIGNRIRCLINGPKAGATILGGKLGVATPRFWAGIRGGAAEGVVGGSWTGLGKYYSVFCRESMLEIVYFPEKDEKLAKNASVNGENGSFWNK